QGSLKLADDQKKQVDELQKDTDTKLEKLLAEDQRKQLKGMLAGGPGGFGGGKGGPGQGPPGGASLFRSVRYAIDDPAFASRTLTPGKTVEELQPPDKGKEKAKEPKGK